MSTRILGIDVGHKRIGVAVSDELLIVSSAVSVIQRSNKSDDIKQILNYIKKYHACKLVVGLPITMKGAESAQTKAVKTFIEELKKSIDIPIETFDERLTTAQSERVLIAADVSRKKRKKIIDKMAAQIILQDYMEFIRNA